MNKKRNSEGINQHIEFQKQVKSFQKSKLSIPNLGDKVKKFGIASSSKVNF